MPFENVYLVNQRLNTATAAQVADAEKNLGFKFPDGYAEFVTRFGEGNYSNFVRVYMPSRIVDECRRFQDRWRKYFLWDAGRDIFAKERIVESFILADTFQGDELIFHPSEPNRLYVLPRYHSTVFEAGNSLPAAIAWLCKSGQLTGPIDFDYFESRQQRQRLMFQGPGNFDSVMQAVKELRLHNHLLHVTEEEDPYCAFFISDFQGSIGMTADDHDVTAWIIHDAELATAGLAKAIACLEELGLVRQVR